MASTINYSKTSSESIINLGNNLANWHSLFLGFTFKIKSTLDINFIVKSSNY